MRGVGGRYALDRVGGSQVGDRRMRVYMDARDEG